VRKRIKGRKKKVKTIKVSVKTSDDKIKKMVVDALWTKGDFVINRHTQWDSWFTLTHVPTGFAIITKKHIKELKPIMMELAALKIRAKLGEFDKNWKKWLDAAWEVVRKYPGSEVTTGQVDVDPEDDVPF